MTNILILDKESSEYAPLFEEYGNILYNKKHLEDSDLIVFTGGPDVHPLLYGDKLLNTTITDLDRDNIEKAIFNMAYVLAIPMVGICRGMQFLNVMNNGLLVQDINNHNNCTHQIDTDEEYFDVVGDHHQMCIPQGNYELLAWTKDIYTYMRGGLGFNIVEALKEIGEEDGSYKEPEAIYWPNTNSLGVQYHPEWMSEETRGYTYFQELLSKYIFNN